MSQVVDVRMSFSRKQVSFGSAVVTRSSALPFYSMDLWWTSSRQTLAWSFPKGTRFPCSTAPSPPQSPPLSSLPTQGVGSFACLRQLPTSCPRASSHPAKMGPKEARGSTGPLAQRLAGGGVGLTRRADAQAGRGSCGLTWTAAHRAHSYRSLRRGHRAESSACHSASSA